MEPIIVKHEECEDMYVGPQVGIIPTGGGGQKRHFNYMGAKNECDDVVRDPYINQNHQNLGFNMTPRQPPKRYRRGEAAVLFSPPFFELPQNLNLKMGDTIMARCVSCRVVLRGHKNVSSNFIKHMKRAHPEVYKMYDNYKILKQHGILARPPATLGLPGEEGFFDSSAFLDDMPQNSNTSSNENEQDSEMTNTKPQIHSGYGVNDNVPTAAGLVPQGGGYRNVESYPPRAYQTQFNPIWSDQGGTFTTTTTINSTTTTSSNTANNRANSQTNSSTNVNDTNVNLINSQWSVNQTRNANAINTTTTTIQPTAQRSANVTTTTTTIKPTAQRSVNVTTTTNTIQPTAQSGANVTTTTNTIQPTAQSGANVTNTMQPPTAQQPEVNLSIQTLQAMSKLFDEKLKSFATKNELTEVTKNIINQVRSRQTTPCSSTIGADEDEEEEGYDGDDIKETSADDDRYKALQRELHAMRTRLDQTEQSKRILQRELHLLEKVVRKRKLIISNIPIAPNQQPISAVEQLLTERFGLPNIMLESVTVLGNRNRMNQDRQTLLVQVVHENDVNAIFRKSSCLRNTGIFIESQMSQISMRRKEKLMVLRREMLRRNGSLRIMVRNAQMLVCDTFFHWDDLLGLCLGNLDTSESELVCGDEAIEELKKLTNLDMKEFLNVLKNYDIR